MTRPNPGSPDAIAAGCTCPVMDNHGGEGFMLRGERLFWLAEGCPVHDPDTPALDREKREAALDDLARIDGETI